MLYNVVLVSAVEPSALTLCVHTFPPPELPSHPNLIPPTRLAQSPELSSLLYTAASPQLSIVHTAMRIHQPQPPDSSPGLACLALPRPAPGGRAGIEMQTEELLLAFKPHPSSHSSPSW